MSKEIEICEDGPIMHYIQICTKNGTNSSIENALKVFYELCAERKEFAINLLIAESNYRINQKMSAHCPTCCPMIRG